MTSQFFMNLVQYVAVILHLLICQIFCGNEESIVHNLYIDNVAAA